MSQGQRRQGHQGAGEEVQRHHDPLLMETVRHHAAQGRQHHHGHERRGGAQAEQAPGTGDVQQIQRQDESQHGVTQQGDDLSNHHQGEVPVKQLFPHLNSSSRSLLPAGPDPAATDRRPGPGAGEAALSGSFFCCLQPFLGQAAKSLPLIQQLLIQQVQAHAPQHLVV